MPLRVSDHYKLRVNKCIVYKIWAVENGFLSFSVVSILHLNLTVVKNLMKNLQFIQMYFQSSSNFLLFYKLYRCGNPLQ